MEKIILESFIISRSLIQKINNGRVNQFHVMRGLYENYDYNYHYSYGNNRFLDKSLDNYGYPITIIDEQFDKLNLY